MLNTSPRADNTDHNHRRSVSGKNRDFMTFLQENSFLLKSRATDGVLKEAYIKVAHLVQPLDMKSFKYAQELFAKTLRYRDFYEKYTLDEMFIENKDPAICHSKRANWRDKKKTELDDPAFHFNSLFRM